MYNTNKWSCSSVSLKDKFALLIRDEYENINCASNSNQLGVMFNVHLKLKPKTQISPNFCEESKRIKRKGSFLSNWEVNDNLGRVFATVTLASKTSVTYFQQSSTVKQNFHLYSVVLYSSPNTEKKILFTPEITLTSWFWLLIQYLK